MLKYRLIFGPLMIAALAAVFYLDDRLDRVALSGPLRSLFLGREYLPAGLLMLLLFVAVISLCAIELTAIFRAKGIHASRLMVGAAAILGLALVYVIPYDASSQDATAIFATVLTLVFLAAMIEYSWLHARTQGAIAVAAVTLLALIYMGVLPGFYLAIRRSHSAWVVAAVLLVTKACDIGAYATGRLVGRHKLIPWLSPGKTWEGLAGGVVLSGLVALGLAALFNHYELAGHWSKHAAGRLWVAHDFPLGGALVAGLLIGAVGQFGDLTASLFKRDAGIKDSGSVIPGFGGLLDVVDSPIVVAPLAYWLLWLAAAAE